MTVTTHQNGTLVADDVKQRASGHWVHLLMTTCGLSEQLLNPKQHHPCPKCGGVDRFRAFDDVDRTGGVYCNQCHAEKNSDGLATIQWLTGWDFRTTLKNVAKELNMEGGAAASQQAPKPKKSRKAHDSIEAAANALAWSMAKDGQLDEQRAPDHVWKYHDASGVEVGAVLRWDTTSGKEIRQVSRDVAGWITKGMTDPRPLFNLPAVLQSSEVWVCEGEKAAAELATLGLVVTTPSQGSNSPDKSDWSVLSEKRVHILPDNDEAGREFAGVVVELLAKHAKGSAVSVHDLADDWPEIPEKGDAADWCEQFDTADVSELVDRLRALPDHTGEYLKPLRFEGIDVADGWKLAEQPVEWLVQDVLSADQPTIFGAKQKSLKTTLLTDLAVSLAAKWPWLGEFDVPAQKRVLFITGEASTKAAMRKVKRAATLRNITRESLKGWLRIETMDFPNLPDAQHCDGLSAVIQRHGFDVVILDPLYMGLQGLNTANLNEVGPAMRRFMQSCKPASTIIAHHVKKSASYDDAPNLEDLSQAGIAEFAGNYWLMGRIGEYQGDGMHSLAIRFGGRDEQFGLLRLQFDEKKWTADMSSLLDYRDDQARARETERFNRWYDMAAKFLQRKHSRGEIASVSSVAEHIGTKPSREGFIEVIDALVERGVAELFSARPTKNSKECECIRLIVSEVTK